MESLVLEQVKVQIKEEKFVKHHPGRIYGVYNAKSYKNPDFTEVQEYNDGNYESFKRFQIINSSQFRRGYKLISDLGNQLKYRGQGRKLMGFSGFKPIYSK